MFIHIVYVVRMHTLDKLHVLARACEARILSQAEILGHTNLLFHLKSEEIFHAAQQ